MAKIMTNIDDEIEKLYGLTKTFASVSVKTSGGMAVSAKMVGYSLKTTSTPGKLVATVTVEGPRKFSDMVSRQVTVDGSQKVLPLQEEDGEPR